MLSFHLVLIRCTYFSLRFRLLNARWRSFFNSEVSMTFSVSVCVKIFALQISLFNKTAQIFNKISFMNFELISQLIELLSDFILCNDSFIYHNSDICFWSDHHAADKILHWDIDYDHDVFFQSILKDLEQHWCNCIWHNYLDWMISLRMRNDIQQIKRVN